MSVERRATGATVHRREHTEHIWAEDLPEHPARVRVSAGVTKNMGDYNSVRCDVSLEMPCDPSKVDECYTACSNWVELRTEEEVLRASEE